MPRYILEILVRDKVVPLMEGQGCIVECRPLTDDAEYAVALSRKIVEELDELDEGGSWDRDKDLGEMADVAEVTEALVELNRGDEYYHELREASSELDAAMNEWEIDNNELLEARAAKNQSRGAFLSRMFVDRVTVPNDNLELIEYYRNKGYQEEAVDKV